MEFNATFLISAISFILFTLIMNKIFYKPLERVMDERQKFIDDTKSDAEKSNLKAQAIINDREERLTKSAADSKKLVADKINEANENSKVVTSNAKQKSQEEIASAKSALKNEAQQTTEELKFKVKDLAEVISSKILGMNTNIENIDNEVVNRILN
uniref:F0F1 ATP synthase subunit B family protein n=1 Tax=Candidatus Stercorousia sp. TaxID=3048886 RepID=UPI004026B189